VINSQDKKSITGWKMTMTDKELKLLDDWIALHREIEKLEAELDTLADKLKKVSRRLYAGKSRAMLEEFSAFLDSEIKKLDRKKDRERINQLKRAGDGY
jgi:uncharacterized coiled-coil protein SlyX